MRVMLIAHTQIIANVPGYVPHVVSPTPADDLAEQAGRLCYLAWGRKNPNTQDNQSYLKNILSQAHYSVLEHASATFYVDGVTRAFLLELERHRHLSYSVVSQRYVDGDEFKFVEHPKLGKLSDETKQRIANLNDDAHDLYRDIVSELTELGDNPKESRGAARTVLLEGTETRLVVTGNLRAWAEILWKRLSPAADAEICDVSRSILVELSRIAPNHFQDFS